MTAWLKRFVAILKLVGLQLKLVGWRFGGDQLVALCRGAVYCPQSVA